MFRKFFLFLVSSIIFSAGVLAQDFDISAAYPAKEARKSSPGGKSYFINPKTGDDKRGNGTKLRPWKTFFPLNKINLRAGDSVEILAPGELTASLALTGTGTAKSPITVKFAPGRYDWIPEKMLRRKLYISNTNDVPYGMKAIAIETLGAENLIIEGKDAIFFCRGKMVQIHINESKNIKLKNFAFDYHRPTVSEYTVDKIGDGFALLTVHPDSAYKISNGQLTWVGEGWETAPSGYGQKLVKEPLSLVRFNSPFGGVDKVEEISPFKLKVYFQKNPGFEEGVVFQHRDIRRDCVGTFCARSENIVWDGVKIHFMHGMGVVSQFTKNIAFRNVTLAPRKESGRTCTAWADFLHFSGCGGKLIFDNVYFNGGNDDCINIHGTHLRIVEKLGPKKLKLRFMHPQTFGFMAYDKGDEVDYINAKTLRTYASAKVVAAKMLNEKEMELTLDKNVPAELAERDALENVTWTAAAEIKNCIVDAQPCRGFLITTRRPVIVENCTFNRCGMRGIFVNDDASGWYESGMVKDLTIRGNTFNFCAEPVIDIFPENPEVRAGNPVHENIKIQNNIFRLRGTKAIALKSCANIEISGNTFFTQEKNLKQENFVSQNAADNVKIRKNSVKQAK